ncbi:uncharacterized protein LOC125954119 isoform X2 [Anopheles darlingi]|uniref:uncharacterized protein LOC125954119 isoform X2 n=1 Tax=Anopheles darlingi TaxID=43151 RepID=UPI0021002511|nr:uncharacterized protein LOC125954119 isoform X2 [Anopheles darlingi]
MATDDAGNVGLEPRSCDHALVGVITALRRTADSVDAYGGTLDRTERHRKVNVGALTVGRNRARIDSRNGPDGLVTPRRVERNPGPGIGAILYHSAASQVLTRRSSGPALRKSRLFLENPGLHALLT